MRDSPKVERVDRDHAAVVPEPFTGFTRGALTAAVRHENDGSGRLIRFDLHRRDRPVIPHVQPPPGRREAAVGRFSGRPSFNLVARCLGYRSQLVARSARPTGH